jgi:hypothetical protein
VVRGTLDETGVYDSSRHEQGSLRHSEVVLDYYRGWFSWLDANEMLEQVVLRHFLSGSVVTSALL